MASNPVEWELPFHSRWFAANSASIVNYLLPESRSQVAICALGILTLKHSNTTGLACPKIHVDIIQFSSPFGYTPDGFFNVFCILRRNMPQYEQRQISGDICRSPQRTAIPDALSVECTSILPLYVAVIKDYLPRYSTY